MALNPASELENRVATSKRRFLLALMLVPALSAFAQATEQADDAQQMPPREIGVAIMGDLHQPLTSDRTGPIADPIAIALHKCTGTHGDTVGINICTAQAYKSYDLVLNQIYTLAISRSDADTRHTLKLSEKKWIAFREEERAAHMNYNKTTRGTIVGVAIGYQNIAAIRERIAELMFYLGADQG